MFDRVYLINLRRRPDRLTNFRQLQRQHQWELPEPTVFPAIDGDKVGVPSWFRSGGGAWGCLRSHCAILEQAVMDGTDTVVVMEDDVTWMPHCWALLAKWIKEVPQDWQQLMLGGQHITPPSKITDTLWRCNNTQRTHAYALKGGGIKSLLKCWYSCNTHCDWKMGEWQGNVKSYCPNNFFFGQCGSSSDICGNVTGVSYWDWHREVTGDFILLLRAPHSVIDNLHGFHRGYFLHTNGQDLGLINISTSDDKANELKKWCKVVEREAEDIGYVPVVWHDSISRDLLGICTGRAIIEVTASNLEEFHEKWKLAIKSAEQH